MIEGQKSFTPAGIARAASLPIVGFWVLDAWRSIPAEMVAFKKCGMVLIPRVLQKYVNKVISTTVQLKFMFAFVLL